MCGLAIAIYQAYRATKLCFWKIVRLVGVAAPQGNRSGRLIRLLSEYEDDRDVGIYTIFPSNRYLLPKVQCFVEFLVESCTNVV
jgi:DNA-binding transcriptional LysR family regulator